MEEVPLVDEIVVIDFELDDRTREIATAMGVPVYIHQEILPEAGPALSGKGEALWKSLHVLKGDIIAWVDTDVTNMHPQFVYGLIGPLLREPRLGYVKGYYHRPIRSEGKTEARGRRARNRVDRAPAAQSLLPAAFGRGPTAGGRVRRSARGA